MRRAPIVVISTAAGLAAVLGFHSRSSGTGLQTVGSASTTVPTSSGPTTTPSTTGGTRTAEGSLVPYPYGRLEVAVTVEGRRITQVDLVTISETDRRSQEIDAQAIPLLRNQVLSAQSATIDGVSGATFTSEAYAQSVASALRKLGLA